MTTRTRVLDTLFPTANASWAHTAVNGTKSSYTYGRLTEAVTGEKKVMTDEVHQQYAKRRGDGDVILGSLHLVKTSREWSDFLYTIGPHPTWGTRTVEGDKISFVEPKVANPLSLGTFPEQLRSLALTKAYANVDPNVIMGGELLGTLDQSVAMLRRPFKGSAQLLGRMIKARKRYLGKTTANAAKATANAWLEYRYGWKPLVMDMQNIVYESERIRDRMERGRLVARAGERLTLTKSASFVASGGIPQIDTARGTVRATTTLRADAGVIYDVSVRSYIQALESFVGLRTNDLPETFWELTPWSFVADWFANLGDWLKSVTPNPYVTIRGDWVTEIEDTALALENVLGETRIASAPATTYTGAIGSSTRRTNIVKRSVNQSVPTLPVWKPTSLTRLQQADAMSLALNPLMGSLRMMRN